jgi:hypothetical protein
MKITKELQDRLDREVGTFGPFGRASLEALLGSDVQPLTAADVSGVYWLELTDDQHRLEERIVAEAEDSWAVQELEDLRDVLTNPAYR